MAKGNTSFESKYQYQKKVTAEICFMPILCSVQCDIQTSTTHEAQWLESLAGYSWTLKNFHKLRVLCAKCKINAYWENKMGPSPVCVQADLTRSTEV